MTRIKTITKIEKINGGEVEIRRLLSDYDLVFNQQGDVIECFRSAKDLYAVVTPVFCKQLQMRTRVCNHEYYDSLIETAQDFCSDVYNTSVATGVWVDTLDGYIHGVLLTKDDEEVLWTLTEEGIPHKHLLGISKYKYGRKLTLHRESKMSKKLWAVTDWLLYK